MRKKHQSQSKNGANRPCVHDHFWDPILCVVLFCFFCVWFCIFVTSTFTRSLRLCIHTRTHLYSRHKHVSALPHECAYIPVHRSFSNFLVCFCYPYLPLSPLSRRFTLCLSLSVHTWPIFAPKTVNVEPRLKIYNKKKAKTHAEFRSGAAPCLSGSKHVSALPHEYAYTPVHRSFSNFLVCFCYPSLSLSALPLECAYQFIVPFQTFWCASAILLYHFPLCLVGLLSVFLSVCTLGQYLRPRP
mmetsp:Transcript_9141/g.19770  ORF Transcript_9141/g.19770 Transcript_9141/m.19770 type:complete len:243 (+) Transcript_9141:117-845(+)